MTTGRLLVLLVGVPTMLAAIGSSALSEVALAGQGSFPVRLNLPARGRAIHISSDSGDLRIGAAQGNRLRITGTAHYSLIRSTVTWRTAPTLVSVFSRCHFFAGQCSFDLQVALPVGAVVDFSDGSGNITVTGLTTTRVTAFDNSGNVTLMFSAVPDLVRVSDQFGDVTLVLPRGQTPYRVNAQASLGHTTITVPTSPSSAHVINVTDSSGNIVIRRRSSA
jgi:hypothetical protein